jgi:hypothetical protein
MGCHRRCPARSRAARSGVPQLGVVAIGLIGAQMGDLRWELSSVSMRRDRSWSAALTRSRWRRCSSQDTTVKLSTWHSGVAMSRHSRQRHDRRAPDRGSDGPGEVLVDRAERDRLGALRRRHEFGLQRLPGRRVERLSDPGGEQQGEDQSRRRQSGDREHAEHGRAAVVSVSINHWAPTVCIQPPMLLANWLSHIARNRGTRSAAKAPLCPSDGGAFTGAARGAGIAGASLCSDSNPRQCMISVNERDTSRRRI